MWSEITSLSLCVYQLSQNGAFHVCGFYETLNAILPGLKVYPTLLVATRPPEVAETVGVYRLAAIGAISCCEIRGRCRRWTRATRRLGVRRAEHRSGCLV